MISILLLTMSGTADASPLNNTPPEVEVRCFMVNGKLVCDPPLMNPQGGDSSITGIRTSDAEEQSDHPWALFMSFDGIDGWYAFALLEDFGDEASYGPAIEGVPDTIGSVTVKDVDGDGNEDLLLEGDGEARVWYGPLSDVRHYDDYDEVF